MLSIADVQTEGNGRRRILPSQISPDSDYPTHDDEQLWDDAPMPCMIRRSGRDRYIAVAERFAALPRPAGLVALSPQRATQSRQHMSLVRTQNHGEKVEEKSQQRMQTEDQPPSKLVIVCNGDIKWPELNKELRPIARSQFNVIEFLQAAKIALGYNAFTCTPMVWHDGMWRRIDDAVLTRVRMAMNRVGFNPTPEFLQAALLDISLSNSYHPVLQYLMQLRWDGKPRLDTWLSTYLGAEDTPINRAFGRCQLMAAVARVRWPGCKKDEMLVLLGPQGIGKSSALRVLASPDWFSDVLKAGMDSKLVIELTEGRWICEFAEMDGLGYKAASAVKAMLSTQNDSSRLAYARITTNRPRQFVCFGSTNESTFLVDDTGNRRFWPVKCGKIDLDALKRDRDQLWAEAYYRVAQGESYELPKELWAEAARAQQDTTLTSPWTEKLETALECKRGNVEAEAVYKHLGLKTDRRNKYIAAQVRRSMEDLGWTKAKRRRGNRQPHCFTNVPTEEGAPWIAI